jgi:hypothetical protein
VSPVKYELGFHIPEDDILHSDRRENLKSYIVLTGCALYKRRNVSCEVLTCSLYTRRLHLQSYGRENLKSYIALTGWALQWRRNVSPVKYDLGFYIAEDGFIVEV